MKHKDKRFPIITMPNNHWEINSGAEDRSGNIVQPIAPGEVWLAPDGYKVVNYKPAALNDKQANSRSKL